MIKIFFAIAPILLGLFYFTWIFIKASKVRNFEKKMYAYKNLMPQQRIIVMHNKEKKIGRVIRRCNVPSGYIVNVGEVINISFPDFVDVVKKQKAMIKKLLKVVNCHECPFCNDDNEFGKDRCNLNDNIEVPVFKELPENQVHNLCPLKDFDIKITL